MTPKQYLFPTLLNSYLGFLLIQVIIRDKTIWVSPIYQYWPKRPILSASVGDWHWEKAVSILPPEWQQQKAW